MPANMGGNVDSVGCMQMVVMCMVSLGLIFSSSSSQWVLQHHIGNTFGSTVPQG